MNFNQNLKAFLKSLPLKKMSGQQKFLAVAAIALAAPDGDFSTGELKQSGSLIVVNRKGTHSFDKYLRKILAESKSHVLIADSYVDGTIFDSVLDVIPKTTTVKLIYTNKSGNFEQRATRFSREYQKFSARKCKWLHDRFMIVDDTGYILGPSIKDAASKYPALVTVLDPKAKRLLQSFFDDLWSKAK